MDRPLRLGEAAALAGVSERTIRRWADRGALEVVRVGAETRYLREDVLRCASGPAKPRGWAVSDHFKFVAPDSPGRSRGSSHEHCAVHRIAELVKYGTGRAAAISATWDVDLQRKSNAAVALALSDQVAGGWSCSEVRQLVDGVMSRWDPEDETNDDDRVVLDSGDGEDNDEDEDEDVDDDDDDGEWSNDA